MILAVLDDSGQNTVQGGLNINVIHRLSPLFRIPRVTLLLNSGAKCDSRLLCIGVARKNDKVDKAVILEVFLTRARRTTLKTRNPAFSTNIQD